MNNNPTTTTTRRGMLPAQQQVSPPTIQEDGSDGNTPAVVVGDDAAPATAAPLATTMTTTSPNGESSPPGTTTTTITADTTTTTNNNKSNNKGGSKIRTWDQMFECLVKFKEENSGSVSVPRQYKPDKNLGEWVVKQRMFQRKLTEHQKKKLTDIGFSFESRLESYDRKWSEMYQELIKYQQENNGSCVIPDSKKGDEGLGKLSRWIHYQRKHYNRGNLPQDRIDKLNKVSFVWSKHSKKRATGGGGKKNNTTTTAAAAGAGAAPTRKEPNTTKIDEKWNAFYTKLEAFYKENGHSKILQDHHDQQLYFWFKTQRTLMHQGLLRADRKERMDQLDMVWDTRETLQKNWEAQFERLKEYKAEKGTINCAHRYEPHGLGNWIAYQKRTFREGSIEPERAKRLLAEDMAYIAEKDQSWNARFVKVKMAMAWHNLSPELQRWTQLQLVLQDCNKQSRDRRIMLDSIRLRQFAAMPGGPLWKPKPKRVPLDMLPLAQQQEQQQKRRQLPVRTTPTKATPRTVHATAAASVADTIGGGKLAVLVNATIATEPVATAAAAAAAASEESTDPMDTSPDTDTTNTANTTTAPKPALSPCRTTMVEGLETTTETEPMIVDGVSPVAKTAAKAPPPATGVAAILAATATTTSPGDTDRGVAATSTPPSPEEPVVEKPKRKRGRPRLYPVVVPTRRKRTWDESFQALSDYKEKHGTVKLELANCDSALVKWAKKQRTYKHSLTEEQTNRLEGIGFCFDGHIAIRENKWEERFNQLADHVNQTGSAVVSRKENKDLNIWISDQRKKYRAGTIRKDRLDRLNSLNFVWNTENSGSNNEGTPKKAGKDPTNTPKYNATWQLYYTKLCAFHKLHGHCDVKANQDQPLLEWVKKQRALYQNKALAQDRIEHLELLGFVWKHKQHNDELAWNSKYSNLVLYKEREGHCDLSTKSDRWGLGSWSGTQKSVFKTGDMPPERARKLLTLGFPVVPEREISWNGRYKKLKEMSREDLDNLWKDPPLQRWVGLQRVLIETDSLPSERKQLMVDLFREMENGTGESSNTSDKTTTEVANPPTDNGQQPTDNGEPLTMLI